MTHPYPGRRALLLAAAAFVASPLPAIGQGRNSVRLLCGFPPGGPADAVCRKLAEKWTVRTGRPLVVDNRSGAAGRLAVTELARAAPDGSTLLLTPASTLTMYPYVYRRLDYDPFEDLVPLHTVAATSFALAAGPAMPEAVRDFRDFIRWARGQSVPILCGNSGAGGMQHLLATLVAREAGVQLQHVPFRGGAPSIQSLVAGELPLAVSTEHAVRPHADAGRLRVLATTGPQRGPLAQVPTFEELGLPALTKREWFGLFAPRQTPSDIAGSYAATLGTILADPDVREAWGRQSLSVDAQPAEQLKAAIRAEHAFWGPVIRQSGFTPEA